MAAYITCYNMYVCMYAWFAFTIADKSTKSVTSIFFIVYTYIFQFGCEQWSCFEIREIRKEKKWTRGEKMALLT